MKLEKMISVRITNDEIKEAVYSWLLTKDERLAKHLSDNYCSIDVCDNGDFVIHVDGVVSYKDEL